MPVEGVPEFEAALAAMVARVQAGALKAAADAGHLVEAATKARAPVRSGTLRRSVRSWVSREDLGEAAYSVAPTTVYARRIELGFHGPDSLGRVYHQGPHPYLKPAVHASLPGIARVIQTRMIAAIRGL